MRKIIALALILAAHNGVAASSQPQNSIPPKSSTTTQLSPSISLTPSLIYTTSNLRDPFRKAASGGSVTRKAFKSSDFNIHNLDLRGLMADSKSNYALLVDVNYGESFILKDGRLYGPRGKPIPGISGHLDVKRKTAYLKARDGDVQVLRLGGKKR